MSALVVPLLAGCADDGLDGPAALAAAATADAKFFQAAEVSLGVYHSCGREQDGDVWCWGLNVAGQLGIGQFTGEEPNPHPLRSLMTGAIEVVAGGHSTYARRADGTIWAWGAGYDGQLGVGESGSAGHRPSPIQTHVIDDAVALTAGWLHACAIRADRTLWCWGDNWLGGLGDGTQTDALVPKHIEAFGTVAEAAAGWSFTCARADDGSVHCTGDNRSGQIGQGSTSPWLYTTPQRVPLAFPAARIFVGRTNACALSAVDGTLACWGGYPVSSLTPRTYPGLGSDVVDVVLGAEHACARKADETLYCWGRNVEGQVGNPTFTSYAEPTPVAVADGWAEVSAGGWHTCGRQSSDDVIWCWGYNVYGQAAALVTLFTPAPVPVD